jgi:hypothetical protein
MGWGGGGSSYYNDSEKAGLSCKFDLRIFRNSLLKLLPGALRVAAKVVEEPVNPLLQLRHFIPLLVVPLPLTPLQRRDGMSSLQLLLKIDSL